LPPVSKPCSGVREKAFRYVRGDGAVGQRLELPRFSATYDPKKREVAITLEKPLATPRELGIWFWDSRGELMAAGGHGLPAGGKSLAFALPIRELGARAALGAAGRG
jgi:hypothetical protein